MHVYSYFTFKEALRKVSVLSRWERQQLLKSSTARQGKRFRFYLDQSFFDRCLQKAQQLNEVYRPCLVAIRLADRLDFEVASNLDRVCPYHSIGEELAWFISKLPERFDNKKLSLSINQQKKMADLLDHLFLRFEILRPNLMLSFVRISKLSLS